MDALLRQASKQTVLDALRELGDHPDVKLSKTQLLERLAQFIEPRQRGGFLSMIAMPIADYFMDNPNTPANPFTTMGSTSADLSQGNFKPKKGSLLNL